MLQNRTSPLTDEKGDIVLALGCLRRGWLLRHLDGPRRWSHPVSGVSSLEKPDIVRTMSAELVIDCRR